MSIPPHPPSPLPHQATPSLFGLPAPAPPSPEQHEAVEEALAAGLPLLEHNGFRVLWQPEGGDLPGPSAAGAAAAASSSSSSSSGEAARRQLAREVAKCCTGDTRLGLGAFVRDSASGGFALMANPMGPLPTGRGVVLVGDLNTAAPRRHGRSAARTTARFLTAAVEDGAKLL